MKSRINKKVTATNVGIEQLTFHYKAEVEEILPERYAMSPSGASIPSHLDSLYELSPANGVLESLSTPFITDNSVLRPREYLNLFNQTACDIEALGIKTETKDLLDAVKSMKKIKVDQNYLAAAFYLLLQV